MTVIDIVYFIVNSNVFWVIISSLSTGAITYLLQNQKNKLEKELQEIKYKEELRSSLINKKLEIYTNAMKEIEEAFKTNNIQNFWYLDWIQTIRLYCNNKTFNAINEFATIWSTEHIREKIEKATNNSENKHLLQEALKPLFAPMSKIETCLREEIQEIYAKTCETKE